MFGARWFLFSTFNWFKCAFLASASQWTRGRKVVLKIVRIAREESSVGRNTAERGKAARIWSVIELTTTAE